MVDPYDLDPEGLAALLGDEPAFRARQVRAWLVRGVDNPLEWTDLPLALRERLRATFSPPPEVLRHTTADGGLTHKLLLRKAAMSAARRREAFASADGLTWEARSADPARRREAFASADGLTWEARSADPARRREAFASADGLTWEARSADPFPEAVEAVLMLYPRVEGRSARATVCVSTQAGCAMACPFCATGQAGLRRQLTLGETIRQVTTMQRLLSSESTGIEGIPTRVTNVVFMGMGEPLANLGVTIAAVRWLADPHGFNLSARAITVSTVGLVPGIRRLATLGLPITLAVSLHAPNDALRDDLVPVNRQHPLPELLAACREYLEATRRRLTFEYVLIAGVNDHLDHASELAGLVRPLRAHVNLIPMNPTPGVSWVAPGKRHQEAFRDVLANRGVAATLRHNRGGDIDAACGQLYADYTLASGRMLPSAKDAWSRWQVAAATAP